MKLNDATETGFIMFVIAVAAVRLGVAAPPSKAPEKSAEIAARFRLRGRWSAPKSVTPVVGNWRIGEDGDNRVLVVDGRNWKRGQTAAGIADRARSLYGDRYAEFLDNVKAFAYYPYVVVNGCDDFQQGEIVMRFKTIEGKIDQGAGILFNLKPNGDYLALRANPLENNLVLWQFVHGKRTSVKWVRDVPTTSHEWHELKLVVKGSNVQGFLDGKSVLTHRLPAPVAGRVGIWSKADSVV